MLVKQGSDYSKSWTHGISLDSIMIKTCKLHDNRKLLYMYQLSTYVIILKQKIKNVLVLLNEVFQ